jgi:hypothetical protein
MEIDLLNGGAPLPVADAQEEQKPECQGVVAQQAVVVAEKTEVIAPPVVVTPSPVAEVVTVKRGPARKWSLWPTERFVRRQLWVERNRDRPWPVRRRWLHDRETGRDCMTEMSLYRSRPDVLANALLDMGVTESGDEAPDRR